MRHFRRYGMPHWKLWPISVQLSLNKQAQMARLPKRPTSCAAEPRLPGQINFALAFPESIAYSLGHIFVIFERSPPWPLPPTVICFFGILALQNNFISREQLLAAFNVWVTAKDKLLGQILHEQKAVDADTCALLEALVGKHLAMHGNDPKSLAALPISSWLNEQMRSLCPPEIQASLAHLSRCQHRSARDRQSSSRRVRRRQDFWRRWCPLPHPPRRTPKAAWAKSSSPKTPNSTARSPSRKSRPQHAGHDSSRGRFVLEAEITGGLEHPGIVPVYGLGTYADGRPFYAMRFIRGDNLKEAIARFHQKSPHRSRRFRR